MLAAFLGTLLCGLGPRAARAVGWRYEVRAVKPGVFVWLPEDIIEEEGDPLYNRAGTAAFVVTSDGVVVVNATNSPIHARELLYEIRQRTSQPVRYLIDTGGSSDEALGNEVFADLEAPIVSTPGIQAEVKIRGESLMARTNGDVKFQRRLRGIHITPPNETFEGERQLSLGGQSIDLIAFDPGLHALAVRLPASKVVFLGDLFQNGYIPRLESRDVRRWIDALRTAESWDAEIYVPGHGEPGGRKEVEDFRQMLEWVANEVQTRLQEGKTPARIRAELVPFKNYDWHAHELEGPLVESLCEQFAAGAGANPQPKP
ncbi:MAG TPA: MBL fold metallo-hydrolase [Terriglobia bacterium]|nr:MBL fold metallo-hydrolase [Terriglobia bacterium]